jgi:hypothetical protein
MYLSIFTVKVIFVVSSNCIDPRFQTLQATVNGKIVFVGLHLDSHDEKILKI